MYVEKKNLLSDPRDAIYNYWKSFSQGLIHEDQVDSFNLPFYTASLGMMAGLVERNGHFSIERLELTNPFWKAQLIFEHG